MAEDSLLWLGCALYLQSVGLEWIIKRAPEHVVEIAIAVREAVHGG